MARRAETRFGTFGRLVGTAVHANGWWLRRAEGVDLPCESPVSHDLSNLIDGLDAVRMKSALAVALQTGDEALDLPIDFIACRVEDATDGQRMDAAYTFVLRESEGRFQLAFAPRTPRAVRDGIVEAFVQRLAFVIDR
jgi:hypothetical protein